MKYDERACKFNMDTGCVELLLRDGRMISILQKMIDADVIVLASPVYFYSISAQLKAVIDCTVARWLEVKDKEFYYITIIADGEKASADTTLTCRGALLCLRAGHLQQNRHKSCFSRCF